MWQAVVMLLSFCCVTHLYALFFIEQLSEPGFGWIIGIFMIVFIPVNHSNLINHGSDMFNSTRVRRNRRCHEKPCLTTKEKIKSQSGNAGLIKNKNTTLICLYSTPKLLRCSQKAFFLNLSKIGLYPE